MVSIENLCELTTEDVGEVINSLTANEAKTLLILAVSIIKKNEKDIQYKNRLVKERFDSTSEHVMPPKGKTELNYEGNNTSNQKKRGRKENDRNTYSVLAERILNGEGEDGVIDGIHYEEIILDSDSKCPICNNDLVQIGEDAMIKVVHVPGTYKLVIYRKKKMVCKNHCDEIFVPFLNDPLEKTHISVSLITKFIRDKFQYGVPPYRQMDDLNNSGIKITYNQIIHHMMKVGLLLQPLAEKIRLYAFEDNPVISIDETLYKLLNPDKIDDEKIRKNNYIFGIVSPKIVSYTFTGARNVDWLIELFDETKYKGCVITDDYGGYSFLNEKEDIKHQLCLCHARRRMFYAYIASRGNKRHRLMYGKKGTIII